jgi:hypothetical protein
MLNHPLPMEVYNDLNFLMNMFKPAQQPTTSGYKEIFMKKPSKKTIALVLDLFKAGHSMRAISRSLGKSEKYIQDVIRKYGKFRWGK